jgi:hypothetical protein
VLCLGLAGVASSDTAAAPPEHQVKAAFMLHFARLVTWPGWPEPDDPNRAFEIAVVGHDPFGARLEATIGTSLVQGRPIRIRLGAGELEQARRILDAVKGRPVLTVGEADGFARAGGVVGFRVAPEGRVAFDVNVAQAERSGLKLSSQLLRVARVVEATP